MPEWEREIRRRLTPLRLAPEREAEIAEEMAQHLEDRYRELRARGASAADAERGALDELGDGALGPGLRAVERRAPADAGSLGAPARAGVFATVRRDVRYGLRVMRTHPGFTAVATLTLALGIGATTAIFSAVNGVLLRPLPYREPERLASFWLTAPEMGLPEVALTEALAAFYRDQSRTFERLAAYYGQGLTLTGAGDPERLAGAAVSLDFFRVLGVRPLHGRTFLPHEDVRDANDFAVLSYALWERRFGRDPGIVGRAITLNATPVVVVGVMPRGFAFPDRAELWIPLGLDPQRFSPWYLSTIARLKAGVTHDGARREIEALSDEFKRRHPELFPQADHGGSKAVVVPLARTIVGDVRLPLLVLLAAVGLVLLIACANIANLLLARAAARRREIAVRCCLGASPGRVAAQLLTESLLLALGGAAGGLALAEWGVRAVRRLPPEVVPRADQVRLDPAVLLFTVAVALATGVLFGLAPALRARRVDLQDAVREGARGTTSASGRRLSDAFVVSQFALSLVLLVGAGLLLRSFQRLLTVDPGFRPDHVLVARLQLPFRKYGEAPRVRAFYDRLLENVRTLPGVRAAGLNQSVPLSRGNPQNEFLVEGKEPLPTEPVPVASIRNVTPGYFEAIGTPLLRGRAFEPDDADSTRLVAIVDETLARRYWPNDDPIGKRIRDGRDPAYFPLRTVVGVVAGVRHTRMDEDAGYHIYLPYAQRVQWTMYLVVRTAGAPEALAAAVRREVAALDPEVPLYEVQTMEQAVGRSLGTKRLTNVLLAGFALTALLLAAIGIYGVMSLAVAGRVREFGVRLALGAHGGDLLRLVLRRGMALALLGVAAGLAAALALTRFLAGLLYGVSPLDPPTFAAVAAVLVAVALAACYVPARRAARADPILALRAE